MANYYQRIILNDRTETYIVKNGQVHLVIESADIQEDGSELGYFKCSETNLTEDEVIALEGIQEISESEGEAYADNVSEWLSFIPGSRPPRKPPAE